MWKFISFSFVSICHLVMAENNSSILEFKQEKVISSNKDSCIVSYKFQIIRSLDSSEGSKYLIEFINADTFLNENITFKWQNTLSSTFEIICQEAKIHILKITLPGNRIVHFIIDQRAFVDQNIPVKFDLYLDEEEFPKNEFVLLELRTNGRGIPIRADLKYINTKKFETYLKAQ